MAGKDSLLGPRPGRKGMETDRWMEPRLVSASGDLLEVFTKARVTLQDLSKERRPKL